MHLSLPKMCTSVLAKSFALFLAKNFAPQFLTFWNALSSHFPLPKTLHFSKQFVFFALSNGVIDRGSKQQSTRSNFRLHRSSFSSKKSKKWIKLIPKTIGNRKRDCAWGCAWGINTTWENLQIEKHKSGRRSFRSPNWFVLFDLQISRVVLIPQAQPHAQSLFLFPIVFGINFFFSQRFANLASPGVSGIRLIFSGAGSNVETCHSTSVIQEMHTSSCTVKWGDLQKISHHR